MANIHETEPTKYSNIIYPQYAIYHGKDRGPSFGGGHDIKISDNTISRFHSIITINNKKIYIKDMISKFGTGILLQNKNFQICDENVISFQLGRSLLTFYQSLKNNSFCKCFNKKKNVINYEVTDEDFYINENKKYINYENGYIIKEND